MLNFCTLFDSRYLHYGLLMYDSLRRTAKSFHLYVFAFDDTCYEYLKNKKYDCITVVSLQELENDKLLKVKAQRSKGEYCWTCTPSTIHYAINSFGLDHCIYVDADLFFYSNPEVLVKEMANKNVLITDHRYTKHHDQSALCGRYCVQFMYFSSEESSLRLLEWWRDECINWCFNRVEDGKFGDQKYLDDWHKYENVHVLQHEGGGLAPWNVQQYTFVRKNGKVTVSNKYSNGSSDLVFYHFHNLKMFNGDIVALSGDEYELAHDVKTLVYAPYVKELIDKVEMLKREEIDIHSTQGGGRLPFVRSSVVYFRVKGIIGWLLRAKMSRPFQISNTYNVSSFLKSYLSR